MFSGVWRSSERDEHAAISPQTASESSAGNGFGAHRDADTRRRLESALSLSCHREGVSGSFASMPFFRTVRARPAIAGQRFAAHAREQAAQQQHLVQASSGCGIRVRHSRFHFRRVQMCPLRTGGFQKETGSDRRVTPAGDVSEATAAPVHENLHFGGEKVMPGESTRAAASPEVGAPVTHLNPTSCADRTSIGGLRCRNLP